MHRIGLATFLLAAPAAASAQSDVELGPACTYETCALRLIGDEVLAGREGREVGSFGFFGAPDLEGLFVISDSATHYFEPVPGRYATGRAMMLAGVGIGSVAYNYLDTGEGSSVERGEWVALGGLLAAVAMVALGAHQQGSAIDATSTAIWWYNGAVASPDSRR